MASCATASLINLLRYGLGRPAGEPAVSFGHLHPRTGKRCAGAGAQIAAARQRLATWLTGVRAALAGRILPFTEHTATLCASMHVPNPRSEREAMIGATALEHGRW